MAFPLVTALAAAPGIISAAAEIIRLIKEKKTVEEEEAQPESERLNEMANLIERQAIVIEGLALNNHYLALAGRNNRILSAISLAIGILAVILSILL